MEIKQNIPAEACFLYMEGLDFPSQYHPNFVRWRASFSHDVDGEGRGLFSDLATAGAYVDGALAGFIQYGRGIRRFDTETAMSNAIAQRFYEKSGFARRGITRSYISADRQEV